MLQSAQICVATRDMGEGECALIHYETGVRSVKWLPGHSGADDDHCPNPVTRTCDPIPVLERHLEHARRRPRDDNWEMVWCGSRPDDTNETFSLFQRCGNGRPEVLPPSEPIVSLAGTPYRGRR